MSATTKHDVHPDAESLNAFAEQSISGRERGRMLEHLAVCGRCRQVVALAREAAEMEVETTAAVTRAAIQPDSWWKRWRLVWVPTAVVAAFTAASISVYVHQADRSAASNNIAEQTTTQNEPVAADSAPPKTVPPVPHAAAKAHAATAKPRVPATPPNSSSQQVVVMAAAPPAPEALEQVEVVPQEAAPASDAGGNGLFHRSFAPAVSSAQPAVRAFREEQKKQDERIFQKEEQQQAEAAENRTLPPPSPETPNLVPPSAPTTDGNTPGDQNAEAPSSNRPIQVSASSIASLGSTKPSHSMAKAAVETAIILPSGLPAVSSAAIGRRMLAIDKAGVLFLSVDAGNHWQRVLRQWTGRAVTVRMHSDSEAVAAQATEQSEAVGAVAGEAPAPSAFFEILNDKNRVWLSTDGELWIAK